MSSAKLPTIGQHLEYIAKLSKAQLDIIIQRDTLYRGSWAELFAARPDLHEASEELRKYERKYETNLGVLVQAYQRSKKEIA